MVSRRKMIDVAVLARAVRQKRIHAAVKGVVEDAEGPLAGVIARPPTIQCYRTVNTVFDRLSGFRKNRVHIRVFATLATILDTVRQDNVPAPRADPSRLTHCEAQMVTVTIILGVDAGRDLAMAAHDTRLMNTNAATTPRPATKITLKMGCWLDEIRNAQNGE